MKKQRETRKNRHEDLKKSGEKSKTHPFDAKKLLNYIDRSIELIKKNEEKKEVAKKKGYE